MEAAPVGGLIILACAAGANVCYWPKADITHCTAHVRFRG